MYIVNGCQRERKFCIPDVFQGLIKAGYYSNVIWVFFGGSGLAVFRDQGSNAKRCCSGSRVSMW